MKWEFDPTKYVEQKDEVVKHDSVAKGGAQTDNPSDVRCSQIDNPLAERGSQTGNTLLGNMFTLEKSTTLFGLPMDVYSDSKDVWMTREQIGTMLGYKDPRIAIANIHAKHKDRLDKFSRVVEMITAGGVQEVVVYNRKGIYELCRHSRQPIADEFYDRVYDVLEEVVINGFYSRISDAELVNTLCERLLKDRKACMQGMKQSKYGITGTHALLMGTHPFDSRLNPDNQMVYEAVGKKRRR